jgi:nicotinamide-nucleotide amidase
MKETSGESRRPIRSAVLLAIGSELTTGETRDTNGGDLATALSRAGVTVEWISALPDTLETVVAALARALDVADLVVTTGGLGPTPDDLTREAIAEVCGEEPAVDPQLVAWLRHLFDRRGLPFYDTNVKQAWLIPSANPIPNERGTAPGWWVDRPDGRIVVALPGPPREMGAMWLNGVMPRLQERGFGQERVTRTYRLTGIGESAVATALGESLLRAANPVVATYARADAVDVRITAVASDGRSPAELVAAAEEKVLAAVGEYVWGYDDDTWPVAIEREISRLGWRVALIEIGTGGTAARLLGEALWLKSARLSSPEGSPDLVDVAAAAQAEARSEVGLAVRAVEEGDDTTVEVAAVGPFGSTATRQVAFLGGMEGRRRAAVATAAFLFRIAQDAVRRKG